MENTRPGTGTIPYTSHLLMISAIAAIVALIITILYLSMAGKTLSAPSRIAAAAAPAATACDISDLLASKQGSPDYIGETRVHTSQRLERLAAEKPTRLAELLKNTWLSE
jgi:flagellar biosynthesis/type III secretory pathway M-ring protein FliF/YscJ